MNFVIDCRRFLTALALLIGAALPAAVVGAELDGDHIAAEVDSVPVTVGEVERFRRQHFSVGQPSEPSAWLDAMALEQLIRQRLVVGYLERTRQGASPEQVAAEIARLRTDAERRQTDWTEHLSQHYGDEDALNRFLAWRLGWSRYVRKQATEAALKDYFDKRRRNFDGTRLRVSQILWKADPGNDAARQQALATAAQVREQITGGKLAFEEAVAQHSQAPSRHKQGDLGFITRRGEMHETFSRAAFALETGEISPPVATPHGIHLIRATEIKPGSKAFEEVRPAVEEQFALDLFEQIAAAERKQATIKLSSGVPHFDSASGKLESTNR